MVINAFIFINQRMRKNDPSPQDTTTSNVVPGPVRKKNSQAFEKVYDNLGLHGIRENGIYYRSTGSLGNQRQKSTKK